MQYLLWNDMIVERFIPNVLLSTCFKNEIFGSYFWDVTSWYQSPGLRDSDTPSGVFELKSRD